ncbi:hypothetical protein COCSUDRAFT_58198 [Coccomyxa subellipsoidea C-169]|uniref:RNI-like protein n=1 Tax=Coccomyxa subellipsoidea (strain C-169) TaxID=574566 RepID=I0YNJ3_COCSC|nr:hypothetical protein COCSUDRAFT_58198 [Coccomyxa subellipsoidea C-169]EIE19962.1 hypothetical protein COCSUDRAFT_58198 [Coccomyxa subellipsoidea C-169]|eukprot:XP_005644506.1 hypothetical protein COCSUDRAFT_58198 [Coccomyxa subellipsoidea C-169]
MQAALDACAGGGATVAPVNICNALGQVLKDFLVCDKMRSDIAHLAAWPALLLLVFTAVAVQSRDEGFGETPPLTSGASLPARRQLIEDTGLWTYPASPYNNTGYYAATIARQSLSPGATFNVSIAQDESKLLEDVIVSASSFKDPSTDISGSPNISVACTPGYGEPLLNATPQAFWWADEPYWEAGLKIRVLDERHLRVEQGIAFRTGTDIGSNITVVRGVICTITNQGEVPIKLDVTVSVDPSTRYDPEEWTEPGALRAIYGSCCKGKAACPEWKAKSEELVYVPSPETKKILTDWCQFPGQTCHANGSLETMDFSNLNLQCSFPFSRLAAFPSITFLTISDNPDMTGTYNDLFTAANDLLALEGLALTGPLGLKGNLAPDYVDLSDNTMAADSQICELVSAEYNGVAVLTLKDLTGLTGPVPACLFENTSLSTLFIGGTGLSGPLPAYKSGTIENMNVTLARGFST